MVVLKRLCVSVFLFLSSVSFAQGIVSSKHPKSFDQPVVSVVVVEKKEISSPLSYPARVVPEVSVAVLSEIDGVVPQVFVHLGQAVKKNQNLLSVQHNEPGYQYKPMAVLATIAGVVSSVDVNAGAPVAKGQKLVTITDPKKVYVEIQVAASDLDFLNSNQQGSLILPQTSPDKSIAMKVIGISPLIDSATGTSACQLKPVHTDDLPLLRPGLVGQIQFSVGKHQGILIPENALNYQGKSTLVNVVKNGKVKSTKVSVGKNQKGQVEILSGLQEGDQVVIRSSRFLTDGVTVSVEQKQEKKP